MACFLGYKSGANYESWHLEQISNLSPVLNVKWTPGLVIIENSNKRCLLVSIASQQHHALSEKGNSLCITGSFLSLYLTSSSLES